MKAWTLFALLVRPLQISLYFFYIYTILAENVAKGRNDRPEEDVIIVDCGELEIEYETDENGKQVPIHAEL